MDVDEFIPFVSTKFWRFVYDTFPGLERVVIHFAYDVYKGALDEGDYFDEIDKEALEQRVEEYEQRVVDFNSRHDGTEIILA